MYGMGDKSIIDVARAMKNGFNAKLLRRLPQVAFLADEGYVARLAPETTLTLHSYEECLASKRAFARISSASRPRATACDRRRYSWNMQPENRWW